MNDGKNEIPQTKKEELIKFRDSQDSRERLCEYITGMRFDNPKLTERLIEDQKVVRAKYGLLDVSMLKNSPEEYENFLMGMASRNGVKIRDRNDFAGYFDRDGAPAAEYFEGKSKIGVTVFRNEDEGKYIRSLIKLEHELIHSIQEKKYPGMPIELLEYEAFIARANTEMAVDDSENFLPIFFGVTLSSVRGDYEDEYLKAEKGTDSPVWDNPEWFLKNVDKVIN